MKYFNFFFMAGEFCSPCYFYEALFHGCFLFHKLKTDFFSTEKHRCPNSLSHIHFRNYDLILVSGEN